MAQSPRCLIRCLNGKIVRQFRYMFGGTFFSLNYYGAQQTTLALLAGLGLSSSTDCGDSWSLSVRPFAVGLATEMD